MDKCFPETLAAARHLKESFKCINCNTLPLEPYFTGVCDHLLCKACISKSNECPKCEAAFYQKDLHVNKMIKEAILYVDQIIGMVSLGNDKNSDNLPDIELNPNAKSSEADTFALPEPVVQTSTATQAKIRSRKNAKSVNSSQVATRSQSTRARKSTQAEPEALASQKPRTQSAKRVRKNDKGETPLHLAVMNNDLDKLKEMLLEPLVDINAKDFAGWTPLHEAVNKDNIEMIKLLIDHNADIDACGYQNNTPLHEAALNKRFESVKFLLEQGADQSVRNDFGVLAKDFVRGEPEFLILFERTVAKATAASPKVDISSSYVSKRAKVKTKKIVLYGSGMKDEEKAKMGRLASKFGIQIAREMSNNGLEDSFESNALLAENDYEAKGSVKIPDSNGPFKGRLNASAQSPKLFEDCYLYFHGEFNVFDKQDLIKLAEQAGAKILKREPKLERVDELITNEIPHHLDLAYDNSFCCSHFLIYDASKVKIDIRHKYLFSVKVNWLFASIDQFKILHPNSLK